MLVKALQLLAGLDHNRAAADSNKCNDREYDHAGAAVAGLSGGGGRGSAAFNVHLGDGVAAVAEHVGKVILLRGNGFVRDIEPDRVLRIFLYLELEGEGEGVVILDRLLIAGEYRKSDVAVVDDVVLFVLILLYKVFPGIRKRDAFDRAVFIRGVQESKLFIVVIEVCKQAYDAFFDLDVLDLDINGDFVAGFVFLRCFDPEVELTVGILFAD